MTIAERARRGEPLNELRIIDAHAHLGCIHPCHITAPAVEEKISAMDALGVEKSAVSSFLAIGPEVERGNDELAEAIRRFPDRIICYAVVNPRVREQVIPELTRCFDQLGMTAIKLHPHFHGYSIEDSICEAVFEFANSRACPVLSHSFGSPDFVRRTSGKYTDMKIIPAHVYHDGGRIDLTKLITVARDTHNVFLDLAFSVVPYATVEKIAAIAGADKVLFGSDSPMMAMSFQIGKVAFANISDEEKRMILGENARRVFGE
jgi:uncharacterized protein